MLRALRLLRDERLLQFRRGRGISVAGTPERGAVVQRTRELVDFARQQGYRTDELIEIIEQVSWTSRVLGNPERIRFSVTATRDGKSSSYDRAPDKGTLSLRLR